MMNRLRWILSSLLAVLAVFFVLSNPARVSLALEPLPWQMDMPVYLVVVISLAVGWLFGTAITWLQGGGTRHDLRRSRRQVRDLENQLKARETELEVARSNAALATPPTVSGQIEPRVGDPASHLAGPAPNQTGGQLGDQTRHQP
jgi:putative membrane protein